MRIPVLLAFTLAPVLSTACTSPGERLPIAQEARISGAAGVLRDVSIEEASVDRFAAPPTAQVTVTNERSGTIELFYEFVWYDQAGTAVGRSTSRRMVALRSGETTILREAAPNARAVDYRIQLFR